MPRRAGLPTRRADRPRRRAAIVALFEGEVALVRDADRQLVVRWFADPAHREWLIERLDAVAVDPAHPLGVGLLSELLAGLGLVERDLVWSEHVRDHADDCLRRAQTLEDAARARIAGTATLVTSPRLRVLAIYARWLLASTVAPLRDAATRALYWYGRIEPAAVLDLALEALAGDDASIAERVLSALYGVVMARAWERGRDGFAGTLATIARAIFDAVFARGAPHPVCHEAVRDYAQHLVRRALVEQPALLTAAERRRIAAPFPGTPKPDWPVIAEDPGSEEDPDNHSPLGPDFANFTLGALVPGRKVNSFRHPGYRKVRGQVLWRIGELGYTWERFAEVERDVAESRFVAGARRAQRYGQKYAWIAYHELAAIRADRGLSRAQRGLDLEPSFPADPHGPRPAFVPALIQPPLDSPAAWVRGGGVPDLAPLLERRDVIGDAACMLLHGELRELQGALHADLHLRAFVVPASSAKLVRAAAERPIWHSEVEVDYTTFAGEYPWAPGLPVGVRDELAFSARPGGQVATIRAMPAIHHSSWTEHDPDLRVRSFANLAPEIARALGLHARPEAWELFDREGRQVTRNFAFGEPWLACTLMYVRRASLTRYLAANRAALVVIARGSRHASSERDGRRPAPERAGIFHRAWVMDA